MAALKGRNLRDRISSADMDAQPFRLDWTEAAAMVKEDDDEPRCQSDKDVSSSVFSPMSCIVEVPL